MSFSIIYLNFAVQNIFMPQLPTYLTRQNLAWFTCAVLIVALLTSKFLLTVGMLALIVLGLVQRDIQAVFRKFLADKALLATTSIFFIVLISGLYSENTAYFMERLRIKLPFLLLPLAYAGLPRFTNRQYHSLLYLLVMVMVISCAGVGIHYAMNFETIIEDIGRSGSVPTPIHHIRFSLLIALSIFAGIFLFNKNFYIKFPFEKYILLACTVFLIVFIHILSVRSGLLALYLAATALVVRYILLTKRYIIGLMMLISIVALPVLAFHFSPAFKAQAYMLRHNYIEFFIKKNIGEYSDTQRLASYLMAIKATEAQPFIGVGMGDIKDATTESYQAHYPNVSPKLPHNQFLFFYTATGLIGLALFTFAFFFPLWYKKRYRDALFLAFYAIVFTSFMVEATLETAIGTAFYILFLLIIQKQVDVT